MAESNVGSRTGITWGLMGGAVVAIVAIMWWLAATSEPSSVAIVEPDSAAADTALADPNSPSATSVDATQFANDPDGYAGQRIRLDGLEIAGMVGDEALWLQLPNSVPYLVHLSGTANSQTGNARTGDRLSVVGTVHMMSDSVLGAWVEQGVITDAQRAEASFATSYLDAARARVVQGGQQASPSQSE